MLGAFSATSDLAALEARYCESVLRWAQEAYLGVKVAWEAWRKEAQR